MRPTMVGGLIAATLSSAACHTTRPVTLDQLEAIRPAQVWVTRGDRSVVVLADPQVSRDRLVGFVNGSFAALPATDVKQVLVRTRSPGRTGALIAASAFGIVAAAYLVSGTGDAPRGPGQACDYGSLTCGDDDGARLGHPDLGRAR